LEGSQVLDGGGGGRRRVRRTNRTVLPALPADAGINRISTPAERSVFREFRRLAQLVGVGAPVVGSVPVEAERRIVSRNPGHRPRLLGRDVCTRARRRGIETRRGVLLPRSRGVHVL